MAPSGPGAAMAFTSSVSVHSFSSPGIADFGRYGERREAFRYRHLSASGASIPRLYAPMEDGDGLGYCRAVRSMGALRRVNGYLVEEMSGGMMAEACVRPSWRATGECASRAVKEPGCQNSARPT